MYRFYEMRTKIRNKKQWLEIISSAAAVVILYAIMYSLGITCPIKWLTGVSCAGCGMTRAWLSVLRLDFKAAFYYHPLFFTVPFAAAVICLGDRLSKKLRYGIYGVLIFLFIAVYI